MKKIIFVGLAIACILGIFLSPFASSSPDGLERVAEDKGFLHKGEGKEVFKAIIPDYIFPGIKHQRLATSLASLVGTIFTFAIAYGLGWVIKRKSR